MEINLKKLEVKFLKNVGPKRGQLLASHGIPTVEDLLMYFPTRYLDRSKVLPMREINVEDECTVIGEVVNCQVAMGRKKRVIVTVTDLTGMISVVFFNQPSYFKKLFSPGKKVALSGKVSYYRGFQLVHPDFEFIGEDEETGIHTGAIIPLYRIPEAFRKAGLTSHLLRRIIHMGLTQYKNHIIETLPLSIIEDENLISRKDVVFNLHFPETMDLFKKALNYVKFEELFYLLILIGIQKKQYNSPHTGIAFKKTGDMVKELIARLPFELTGAQKRVLQEIYGDMQKDIPMHRLIQGDVGSGKTIVALISMLIARENGYQTALMAPTEILAEQHYYNFTALLKPFNIKPLLLKGSQSRTIKKTVLTALKNDPRAIVVGTHALIQKEVDFKNLGFVVIDEQHRFGVLQRASFIDKGKVPDILVMTAPPIPRTLSFTVFGDLDHSRIDEMPPGRKPVITAWRKKNRLPKIYSFIKERIADGEQVYIVLPLIEESEKLDVKAAEQLYDELSKSWFKDVNISLLHGKMKTAAKEQVMSDFKAGDIKLLVSTTVIEVGVDVPNATIMMIIDAQRFGLAQLHQLRGRVGRGKLRSYCILITPGQVNEVAEERMKILTKTTDGFIVAEKDLQLRGMGQMLGARQHGVNELIFTDFSRDGSLVEHVRKIAFKTIDQDPHLRLPANKLIREKIISKYEDKLVYIQSL